MRYARLGPFVCLFSFGALYCMIGAQAAPFQDIPAGVNDALLGGTSLYAAKMICSAMILASIGLALSVGKVNFMATVIVMLATLAVLVSIAWLDFWLIIIVSLLIVAMFGRAMVDWVTGSQTGG